MLWRVSRRHLARHPWQIGLSVLGVALGVAVALSIDLANGSARRAFALATEAVTGRTTHQIVGGPIGLDETLYRTLRGARGAARRRPPRPCGPGPGAAGSDRAAIGSRFSSSC